MVLSSIGTICTAVNATKSLVTIVSSYKQIGEQEQTKRRGIAALEKTQCVDAVSSAYTEYKIIAEQEQTKRREIEAWKNETITKINAQRELLMAYLDRSFDERAENFRALFAVVDNAIASGNNEQLTLTLNSITEIAKSSPFKDLANLASVRAALDDPDHEWIF
jgi:ribonucleotide reductase alpha subunit